MSKMDRKGAYVAIRVEPVTAENLRKFAKILSDMADSLDVRAEQGASGGVAK